MNKDFNPEDYEEVGQRSTLLKVGEHIQGTYNGTEHVKEERDGELTEFDYALIQTEEGKTAKIPLGYELIQKFKNAEIKEGDSIAIVREQDLKIGKNKTMKRFKVFRKK